MIHFNTDVRPNVHHSSSSRMLDTPSYVCIVRCHLNTSDILYPPNLIQHTHISISRYVHTELQIWKHHNYLDEYI